MRLKKILLVIVGFLVLCLGAIGLFIPILPTTPFILVAAACFAGSSPRLYTWLENNRYFGEFITNYRTKRGISSKTKYRAFAFLWTTLFISAVVFRTWHVWLVLFFVGICVSIHIAFIKKIPENYA